MHHHKPTSTPRNLTGAERQAFGGRALSLHFPPILSRRDWMGEVSREWHAAFQTRIPQTLAEGFADCFFGGPEVEEGDQVVGLLGHPLEFGGVEPAVGEGAHLAGMDVFDVHAERTRQRRGNHHEIAAVADAHGQPVNVRLPVVRVMKRRRADKRARQIEQQPVGSGARLGAGRRHPDMYRITHRKKVTP
nr:hypothetical protein [Kribbella pittospori]